MKSYLKLPLSASNFPVNHLVLASTVIQQSFMTIMYFLC